MLTERQSQKVHGLRLKTPLVAAAGLAAAAVLGALSGLTNEHGLITGIFQAIYVGYMVVAGLGFSSLAVVMVHHLCGGAWSHMILRICEAGSRTIIPLFLIGIIVILGGAWFGGIYPWTSHDYLEAKHIVQNKTAFLNLPFFTLCYFVYFGLWIALAAIYNKWSRDLDATGDPAIIQKMQLLAGPGLIIYVISMTFAATHWVMSLEAEWFSTIYGAWMIAGYALSTIAFCAIVLSYLREEGPVAEKVTDRHFYHLGTFLCGFTIFWSYVSFSQFLIIWNGNLPEEIGFYLHRIGDSLNVLTVMLMVINWAFPMFFLLIRRHKTWMPRLRFICFWILASRVLDWYWNVVPSWPGHFYELRIFMVLGVVASVIGFAALWLWLFLGEFQKRPVLPLNDPRGEIFFMKDAHSHA